MGDLCSSYRGGSIAITSSEVADAAEPTSEDHSEKASNLLSSLGAFDPETQTADDLKKISGVGPKMEQKLHELGIFTFEQVSRMTDTEYDLLDSITGEFPGRAKRDDWAGQADKLKNS